MRWASFSGSSFSIASEIAKRDISRFPIGAASNESYSFGVRFRRSRAFYTSTNTNHDDESSELNTLFTRSGPRSTTVSFRHFLLQVTQKRWRKRLGLKLLGALR